MTIDGITKKLILGNKSAEQMALSFITSPTLINIDPRQGAIYAIPLECETNQMSANAEVSESLIISSEAKVNVSDNVAPGSKNWRLSGYIIGKPGLEPTSKFMPFVRLHNDILWNWFNHGAVLIYKDGNAQIHDNVVIKELQTSQDKDCANATPFSMTLKQINVMEMDLTQIAEDATNGLNKIKNSLAKIGSKLGKAKTTGSSTSTTSALSTVAELTA